MREIKYTTRFQRDYRREKSGRNGKKLDNLLLAADTSLPRRNFDHPLSGEWSDHRDCHIRPDLVLIYRKPDNDSLELVRLGSHSELGLRKTAPATSAASALRYAPVVCSQSPAESYST